MRLHSTCVAEKHDWRVQLLHLARLNSPKKNHNRTTNSKVSWIVSLQSDTTSPPVLFITAFAQGREDILNLSSCIHKRALLLNIGRNKDIRERERHYLCLEPDINGKPQRKLLAQATFIKTTKMPLCWQVLAKDLSTQTTQFFQLYEMV